MAIQLKTTGSAYATLPNVNTTTIGFQFYSATYGPNWFVLEGITTEPKYAIQIWTADLVTMIADLRQAADPNGEGAFDVSKILQSYVAPPTGQDAQYFDYQTNIEWVGYYGNPFHKAYNEVFDYKVKIGYEDTDGAFQALATYGPYTTIGGAYNIEYQGSTPGEYPIGTLDLFLPSQEYQSALVRCKADGCTEIVGSAAKPFGFSAYLNYSLTDNRNKLKWDTGVKPLPGGVPTEASQKWIWANKTTFGALQTISFLNKVTTSTGSEICEIAPNSIAAVRLQSYDGETLVDDIIYPNLTTEGGGPNSYIGEGIPVSGNTTALYFGAGGLNLLGDVSANVTHYYLSTLINQYTGAPCDSVPGWPQLNSDPVEVWRFDILEDRCDDYPPVTLSWLNSRGFMDYYIFNKRSDFKTTVKRGTYYSGYDPTSGTTYNNWGPNSRGTTTFTADIEDQWTFTTDWLTDLEALSLRSLFLSSDVRMDIQGGSNINIFAVQVQDVQWQEKTSRKDKLFQYTITVKRAKKQNQNRG